MDFSYLEEAGKFYNEEVFVYSRNVNQPIVTALSGISFPNPKYEIIRKNSACYSIEYVYEGSGVIQHGSDIFKADAGDCFILHPNKYHHYFSSPKKPWKKIWILIENNFDFVEHIIKDYHLDNTVLIKNFNDPSKFEECLDMVRTNDQSKKIEIQLLSLISDISDFVFTHNSHNNNGSNNKYADELNMLLSRNLYTNLTMTECCDYIGMGKSQLTELFKKSYNDTPMAYYTKLKLKSAKTYLEQTELTVSEIAIKHSFKSVYHFSSLFKKSTGLSPTEYRLKFKPK